LENQWVGEHVFRLFRRCVNPFKAISSVPRTPSKRSKSEPNGSTEPTFYEITLGRFYEITPEQNGKDDPTHNDANNQHMTGLKIDSSRVVRVHHRRIVEQRKQCSAIAIR
jgi:hypothetical protein